MNYELVITINSFETQFSNSGKSEFPKDIKRYVNRVYADYDEHEIEVLKIIREDPLVESVAVRGEYFRAIEKAHENRTYEENQKYGVF